MIRRLWIIVALAALMLTSCGASLRLQATAPAQLNGGTCALPQLSSSPAWPMMLHFAWSGPAAGEDSVPCNPGQLVTWSHGVPAGTYTIRGWASNAYGAGCDTTITKAAGDPPGKPVLQ
jgi:hypothetical protein